MLGTFIIIVLGTCLGLTQVCRVSVIGFLARNPQIFFFPNLHYALYLGLYDYDDPASSDFQILATCLIMALPFMLYVDPIQTWADDTANIQSTGFLAGRVTCFAATVIIGDILAKPFQVFASEFMSRLIPSLENTPHPLDREEMKPKHQRYESYAEFSERRRREAWESSYFARDYENYEDYARRNRGYSANSRTRSYAKAKTQSVPHTPRVRALRVLGLSGHPTQKEIKSAYRRLARKNHPDNFMTQGPQALARAEEKMKDINAAYDYLKTKTD